MQKVKKDTIFLAILFFMGLAADYLIVNTTYAFLYSQELYEMVKEQYELIGQISSYGSVISATMASTSFAEWSAAAFSNVG